VSKKRTPTGAREGTWVVSTQTHGTLMGWIAAFGYAVLVALLWAMR